MSEEMKRELTELKTDVEDIKSVNRRIIATLVRLEGKVDDMGERMATKDDIGRVMNHIDGLGAKVEDFNFRLAAQGYALDDHDKRLKKLETKRS